MKKIVISLLFLIGLMTSSLAQDKNFSIEQIDGVVVYFMPIDAIGRDPQAKPREAFYRWKGNSFFLEHYDKHRKVFVRSERSYYLSETPDKEFNPEKVGKSKKGKYIISLMYNKKDRNEASILELGEITDDYIKMWYTTNLDPKTITYQKIKSEDYNEIIKGKTIEVKDMGVVHK